MKKLVLSAVFASAMLVVSCDEKKAAVEETTTTETETTVDPATETQTTTTTTETTLEVPKFSSPEAQKMAEEYTAFIKEQMDAAKSGDAAKITELQAKATEWSKKQAELAGKLTAEDVKLWQEYVTKLSEQLAKGM
ncbi:hypothetical protein MG290_09460 [Flavobacterium sp. CBA20B-1]|uniref:Uncharacterized protein n=1 Tax=Paenimyroides aestuarii TaxID=2968490 RepID=A0ABY5NVE5_9FLAO|nr:MULTISPECIES: hypothetical protein [Flavobacteriaceae]UUV22438.1 hypothetical protein NPX36_05205 [Paenimyroides aestuarii]WCM41183.1 hypothetical protein MG290_09460 [Flavobacterium sp. CBA20B-1]